MTVQTDLMTAAQVAVGYMNTLEEDLGNCQQALDAATASIATMNTTIQQLEAVATQRDEIIVCLSDKLDAAEAKLLTCDCPEEVVPSPMDVLLGHTRWGAVAKPGTLAAFATLEALIANGNPDVKLESRRIFLSGDLDWTVDTAAGRIPIVEVPLGITQAQLDVIVATATADDKPVVFTIGHEEEAPSKGNSATYFKNEVARISPILRQAPKAIVIVTFMNGTARGLTTGVTIADWLPSSAYIDAIGFDTYIGNPTNLPYNSHDNVLKPALKIAHDLGVPLMYPEFAVGGAKSVRNAYVAGVAQWIADVRSGVKTFSDIPNAADFVAVIVDWFNSNIGGGPPMTYDGTVGWEINKAADTVDTLTPATWASLILGNGV